MTRSLLITSCIVHLLRTALFSTSRVPIPRHKTARLNAYFVRSTTPCAHYSSMHPCHQPTGLRPSL
jgi:hypothetical protein